ncbi:PP2C family protein-serine/threonine phosphatase [Umezawaea beigongshangensis]|uniref:PP2C family protein-serine/threonine phosphatase n=1 Tax=Umezawaea beigongshangensis TaxID=2780383 RepID=UPI0027DCAE59|nr:PP2C family protein-serine/threonine phosphatase [Umezawaea beigongshangensis]
MIRRVESWYAAFGAIVNEGHLVSADGLVSLVDAAVADLGIEVRFYLVDLPQRQLHPVAADAGPSLPVDEGVPGRTFQLCAIVRDEDEHGGVLWLPLLDGTERLGVLRVALPAGTDPDDSWIREQCWTLSGLLAHVVSSKAHYSDLFHVVRRSRQLTLSAELLWQLLPPQTFATPRVVVTAVVEPYAEVGGDAYDYAVDGDRAYVAVFDAMGHDTRAGTTSGLALAATRNARRGGLPLVDAAAFADRAIAEQNADTRFATALLAELNLETGVFEHLNAGHPPPVLLRGNGFLKNLGGVSCPPLGLGHLVGAVPKLEREQLEPGDRVLLYTDGVVEARDEAGTQFGLDRLVDLVEHHHREGLPAPETLRRIVHAVLDHQHGSLQDDATMLLLEWPTSPARLLPDV